MQILAPGPTDTPVRLYYWRGQGVLGSLIRHGCASPWDHVAVAVEFDYLPCYFEAYPGAGFRMVPVSGDRPPDGVQDTGKEWTVGKAAQAMLELSRRQYSRWNGLLAAFGINRHSRRIECAQAASAILQILGMAVDSSNPEGVAEAVERITRNPVRMTR